MGKTKSNFQQRNPKKSKRIFRLQKKKEENEKQKLNIYQKKHKKKYKARRITI